MFEEDEITFSLGYEKLDWRMIRSLQLKIFFLLC